MNNPLVIYHDLPPEIVEKILLSFDFDAWRRARFVCHEWAKICAKNAQKIDEFVQYGFKDKHFKETMWWHNPLNHYIPYLPNGIKHGMSYEYFNGSESIRKMNLWIYGRSILKIRYNSPACGETLATIRDLCYEMNYPQNAGNTIFTIMYVREPYWFRIEKHK